MKAIINYFVDLCLLRAGPQDIPGSQVLLIILLAADVVVGFLLVVGPRTDLGAALGESVAEPLLLLLVLWVGLRLRHRAQRFVQTAMASAGSSTLLGLIALPLVGSAGSEDPSLAGGLSALLLLLLIAWSILVFGHILRHALDVTLPIGSALALAYTVVSYLLLGLLFPVS